MGFLLLFKIFSWLCWKLVVLRGCIGDKSCYQGPHGNIATTFVVRVLCLHNKTEKLSVLSFILLSINYLFHNLTERDNLLRLEQSLCQSWWREFSTDKFATWYRLERSRLRLPAEVLQISYVHEQRGSFRQQFLGWLRMWSSLIQRLLFGAGATTDKGKSRLMLKIGSLPKTQKKTIGCNVLPVYILVSLSKSDFSVHTHIWWQRRFWRRTQIGS